MNKTVLKDNFREIKNNLGRFLSILLLLLIAAIAFTGIYQGVLLLEEGPQEFFSKTNYEDINIVSTAGLDQKDEIVIGSNPYVKDYEMVYMVDVIDSQANEIVRLEMLTDSISKPLLVEGEYPKKYNEIALFEESKDLYDIGDTIEFVNQDYEKDIDSLHTDKFTVVGYVQSPKYLRNEINKYSLIDGGMVSNYGYILESAFDLEYYTSAIVKVNDQYKFYEEEYENLVNQGINSLKEDFSKRPREKYNELQSEIDDLIVEAEDELNKAKEELKNARDELSDGEIKILEAKEEIADSQRQLLKARKDLDIGWDQYYNGKRTYDQEISSGERQITNSEKKLNEAKKEIDYGKSQIIQGEEALEASKKELENLANQGDNSQLDKYRESESLYQTNYESFQEEKANYENILSNYNNKLKELENSKNHLENFKNQLIKLESSSTNPNSLENQINELEADISKTQRSLDIKKEEVKSLRLKSNNLKAENNNLQKKANEISGQIAQGEDTGSLQGQLDEINNQISINNSEIIQLDSQAQLALSEVDRLKGQLGVLSNELKAIYQEVGTTETTSDIRNKINRLEDEIEASENSLAKSKEQLDQSKILLDQKENQLKTTRKELDQVKSQVEGQEARLDQALGQISASEEELEISRQQIDQAENEYNAGLEELKLARQTLETEKLRGESKLQALLRKLNTGESKYKSGMDQLQDARILLAEAEEDYQAGLIQYEEESPDAIEAIDKGESELAEAKENQIKLKTPEFMINSRNADQDYFTIKDFPKGLSKLVYVFSGLALAVAILVVANNMTRMIDENRVLMGTYKGLGYSSKTIASKFIIFGGISGILGAIIGSIFGQLVLGPILYDIYMSGFILEGSQGYIRPTMTILAIVVAFITTVIVAIASSYKTLKQNTASLLRPKPPKGGNRIFLENIRPIWENFSFMNKITGRNLFRYKGRMLMTTLGVGVCMGLLVLGLSMKFSMSGILDTQYGDILKYQLSAQYNEDISDQDLANITSLLNEERVRFSLVSTDILRLTMPDGNTQDVSLYIDGNGFEDFVEFTDLQGNSFDLDDEGIVITEKLAYIMGLEIADTLELEIEGRTYDFKIANIMKNYISHGIYMDTDYFEDVIGNKVNNNTLWTLSTNNKIERYLEENDDILNLINIEDLKEYSGEALESLDVVIVIIVAIALLLAIVVQYSLTSINVDERIRELSTMKVLGFYPKEITMYVFKETIILSLMGILVGIVLGKIIVDYILVEFAPSNIIFGDPNYPISILISALLTMLFTVIVMFIVHIKLKNVDMLEALSSVE